MQIWTLKTCNQDIPKIIIARSVKLCQLIEDDEYRLPGEIKKEKYFLVIALCKFGYLKRLFYIFKLLPIANLDFENL